MTWRPWDSREVQRVFTTESRQKNRHLFQRTHYPIRRILVSHNRIGLSNQSFVSEADLRTLLQDSQPLEHNRVFFIVGETGSGKSELCQWLEYNLAATHRPIHISRRQSSLDGILTTLLQSAPDLALPTGTLPPQDIFEEYLRTHLNLQAHRAEHSDWIAYLREASVGIRRATQLLYEHKCTPDLDQLSDAFPACPDLAVLGGWIQSGIREAFGVRTLEPVLKGLVEHFAARGERPVLLLEDITTLGFLRDDLLDFIFDLSTPGFDVVMGLTTGFESSRLTLGSNLNDLAYVRDRLTARLVLSNTSGETFFLSSASDLADLVQGYLACLPAVSAPKAFQGLFPLTPHTLERLYVHLIESGTPRQTPRNLLDAVIRPLLSQDKPPYLALMDAHPYLRTPSILFRQDGLSIEEVGLLYWYGERKNGRYRVPYPISKRFGFTGHISAEAYEMPTENPSIIPATPQKDDERQREWEEAFRQLRAWRQRNASTPFPKRHLLKKGLERFIHGVAAPRLVQNLHGNSSEADALKFHRGSTALPIFLPESGDVLPEGDWPVLFVPKHTPQRRLEEFLNYAFGAPESIQCFADPADTFEFVSGMIQRFQTALRTHLERTLGLSIESFAFGAWWLSQHLAFGATAAALQDQTTLLDYRPIPEDIVRAWDDPARLKILTRTNEKLLQLRSAYRGLFLSLFHTRDDFTDPELIEQEMDTFHFPTWVASIAKIDLRRIRKLPFRQERSERSLYDLVKPVVEYARALSQYEGFSDDVERLKEALATLQIHLSPGPRTSRKLGRLAEMTQELGWMEWSIPTPPNISVQAGQRLAERVRHVLTSMVAEPLCGATVLRFWLAELLRVPIVRWDVELRNHLTRLQDMLDVHLPRQPALAEQQHASAERALHIVMALRTALA